jgi:2-hydroxy-4-carboxymuconate semialdehyde hemiacetal dehydrogenase
VPGPRIAIVGYGAIADLHAEALRKAGASLELVVGPSPDGARAFAEAHALRAWSVDVEQAWSSESIDAVVIASPNAVHESQSMAALARGKHVLCEVPLATSVAGASRVAAAARNADTAFMVAHTQRYWPPAMELHRRIADGTLTPLHASIRYMLWRRENVGWTGRARSWTDSLLWHHGAHAVDTALWLLGSPVGRLTAAAGRSPGGKDQPMDISIGLRTPTGRLASIVLSYNSKIPLVDVTVIGDEDTLLLEQAVLADSSGNAIVSAADAATMQTDAVRAQDEAFLNAVTRGFMPTPSPDDVLDAYRALGVVEELISVDVLEAEGVRRVTDDPPVTDRE